MALAVHTTLVLVCDGYKVWRVDCSDAAKHRAVDGCLLPDDLSGVKWHQLCDACGECRACNKTSRFRKAVGKPTTAFDRPGGLGFTIKSAF